MKYAAGTEVSSEKSRMEIETTLRRYGATGFMYGWQPASAMVAFEAHGRTIKFMLPLPDKTDQKFTHFKRGGSQWALTPRTEAAALAAWEQACRQRWRALALCIKAKLEAVECGITTFEQEFLAHFIAADGRTVGEHIIPQLNDTTNPRALSLMGRGDYPL